MNRETLYSALIASGGAVVTQIISQDTTWRGRTPPFVALPRLPHTSAAWIEHTVDSDGYLLRVARESPALAVRIDSLPGGVEETGDGTPEHPFVNANSLRERFNDCLIRALGCAGFVLSVTVTGTVDYTLRLPGGAGNSVVCDFSGAEVGGSALLEFPGVGGRVVRELHAPYSVFGTVTVNTVFNDCGWWGPPSVIRSRMMRAAGNCTFDRCDFSADRSFFTTLDTCTVAGGTFRSSEASPFAGLSRCVLSGVSAVSERSGSETAGDYSDWGAVTGARNSIFEDCSAELHCSIASEGNLPSDWYWDVYVGAVAACSACAFDRCSATVSLDSGTPPHLCLQACGFQRNSASVFRQCTGNSFVTGNCSHSGFVEIPCDS